MNKETNRAAQVYPAGEGVLPIIAVMPWLARLDDQWRAPTYADFEGLAECGFNVAVVLATEYEKIKDAFTYAEQTGIRCMLEQYYHMTNQTMVDLVERFKSNNSLVGFKLKSEPPFTWLNAGGEIRDICTKLRELSAGIIWMDLAYSLDPKIVGNYKDYSSYLWYVFRNCMPGVWASNLHPLRSASGSIYMNDVSFFNALATYSSVDSAVPFWSCCNCSSSASGSTVRPAPTAGVMRYEAFNALAYGAQGIVFADYAQRSGEIHISAPVNRKGERTDLWYAVQEVISEIKRYSYIFLGCDVQSTFLRSPGIGDTEMQALSAVSPVTGITSEDGKGVTVSRLSNGGYNYIVIVSRDPFREQKITVSYKAGYVTTHKTVELTPNFMQEGVVGEPEIKMGKTLTLDAGGYAIIRWGGEYF